MPNKRGDEETYSLIFSSLKHPIRRKILRMLENGEMTFSEILGILAIDSGHLSYHLENLGDLITHTRDGKYKLSSFGLAANGLMKGVEEHHPPLVAKSRMKVDTTIKMFSTILAVTLLIASSYSINLATTTHADVASWSGIPFALTQNQTLSYPVNFTYGKSFESRAASYGIEIVTSDFGNSINEWTEYYFFLNFEFNQTYQLNMTVRELPSKILSSARWDGDPGRFGAGTGDIITHPGTYEVEIRNIGTESFNGEMGIQVLEHTHRDQCSITDLADL